MAHQLPVFFFAPTKVFSCNLKDSKGNYKALCIGYCALLIGSKRCQKVWTVGLSINPGK